MNLSHSHLLAVALALAVFGGVVALLTPRGEDAAAARNVIGYEVVYQEGEEPTILYDYTGEELPEKLVPDEAVEKRTENSYTRYLGAEHEGTADERSIYQAIIYEQDIYVQAGGRWYLRESATTTESAFLDAKPLYRIARAFSTAVAYAASYAGFSTSSDGRYRANALGNIDDGNAGFGNCVNGIGVDGSDIVSSSLAATTGDVQVTETLTGFGSCDIRRGYFTFDTSSVPSGSNVSAASFQMYVTAKTNGDNDGDDVLYLVVPNISTWTSWGSTAGANTIDITAVSTSAYNTFTLNATGFGFLTLGGSTQLGVREGHDVTGVAPSSTNSVTFSTSEQTGTSQDPTLSITYTAGSKAFWMFQDF